jgi:enoyl-CoA hydratase/carnithine racemase
VGVPFGSIGVKDEIVIERAGRVLRVRVNRPEKHNPLSRAALARLQAAFDAHRDDEALACAVITGPGHRYFAAGGDLRDLSAVRTRDEARRMAEAARAALDAVRTFPLPVIALVNGDALGGGAELALACDLRVMSDGAHIGYVQGRLAITSAWGGGPDLCAVVGPARALRMMARCERVPAATALAWGLADAVAPADALEDGLREFIEPLLAQTRGALRTFKAQTLAARRGESYEARRAAEADAFAGEWISPAHWAAVDRILSRRAS